MDWWDSHRQPIDYVSSLSIILEGQYLRINWLKSYYTGDAPARKRKQNVSSETERFESSLARTKSLLRGLVRCNSWDYFATFTLDPNKWDSKNFDQFYPAMSKFINHLNERRDDGKKFKYVFVPEYHKDGKIHLHGVCSGIPETALSINENGYLDWTAWREKFGFLSLSKIKDKNAVSIYICKYVGKNIESQSVVGRNRQSILHSKGLLKPTKIALIPEVGIEDFYNLVGKAKIYESKDGYVKTAEIDCNGSNVPFRIQEFMERMNER